MPIGSHEKQDRENKKKENYIFFKRRRIETLLFKSREYRHMESERL